MKSILRTKRSRRGLILLGVATVTTAGFQNCARETSTMTSSSSANFGSARLLTQSGTQSTRRTMAAGPAVAAGINVTSQPVSHGSDGAMHHEQWDVYGYLDRFDGRTVYGWACVNYSDVARGVVPVYNSTPGAIGVVNSAGAFLGYQELQVLRTEAEGAIQQQCLNSNQYFRFQIMFTDATLDAYGGQTLEIRTTAQDPQIPPMQLGYVTLANPAPSTNRPPAGPMYGQAVSCTDDAVAAPPTGGINGTY